MVKGTGNEEGLRGVPRDLWKEAVAADPAVDITQTPEWVDAICETGGYVDASRYYETPDGRALIVPMVRRAGVAGLLPVAESFPGMWGTGGVLSTGGALRPQDLELAWEHLVREPVARLRMRPEHGALPAWTGGRLPASVSMEEQYKSVIDLRGGFDQVWKNFKSTARTRARRAEKDGIVVEYDDTGRLVDTYYDMYLRWVARRARERGLPERAMVWRAQRVEPRRKFHVVAQKLGTACRVWVARRDGMPVAATITFAYGDHATYWRSCSDKESAGAANNLMQKHIIEHMCEVGCLDYNLGWSGNPSLLRYKRTLGAVPVLFPIYSWERIPLSRVERLQSSARAAVLGLRHRRERAAEDTPAE